MTTKLKNQYQQVRKHMIKSLEAYMEMEKMLINNTLSKRNQVAYNKMKNVLLDMAPIEREIIQHKYIGSIKKDLDVYHSFFKERMKYKKYLELEKKAVVNFAKEAVKIEV